MLGTTTAVDVIQGGVKVNALPEVVETLVNFRIDFDESVDFAQRHVEHLLRKVAKTHDLAFEGFAASGSMANANWTSSGTGTGTGIKVELVGEPLEPAPRTPASGPVWELFAGTVKSVSDPLWLHWLKLTWQSGNPRARWQRSHRRTVCFDVCPPYISSRQH